MNRWPHRRDRTFLPSFTSVLLTEHLGDSLLTMKSIPCRGAERLQLWKQWLGENHDTVITGFWYYLRGVSLLFPALIFFYHIYSIKEESEF